MFYRGFDGLLLRERFLEGNDTHEIKLILAVSRNANAQRAKNFTVGERDWQMKNWVQIMGRGVATKGVWPREGRGPRCCV